MFHIPPKGRSRQAVRRVFQQANQRFSRGQQENRLKCDPSPINGKGTVVAKNRVAASRLN
jgi:hypothetical protein